MIPWYKKAWTWIKANFKLILICLLVLLVIIPYILLAVKSKKVRSLELDLRLLKAKIDMDKLSVKYDSEVEDLKTLKEKDAKLKAELAKIEESLRNSMTNQEMTADEVIEELKKLNLV